jgi:electron transport complex protein RnfB
LIVLQQQFEAAEQALTALEVNLAPATPAPDSSADLKRAKIQLAMRRAELKKAQDQNADPQQLAEAQNKLDAAQRQVDAHGHA